MKALGRFGMLILGIALSAVYLAGAWGVRERRTESPPVSGNAAISFHGGKTHGSGRKDSVCQAKGCHDPFPHKKKSASSAFENFHQDFVDCLACHGKDAESRWRYEAGPEGGRRILKCSPAAAVQEPHMLLRPPVKCRGCHSEAGLMILRERGARELSQGFENPIALRMLEEGGTRWNDGVFR